MNDIKAHVTERVNGWFKDFYSTEGTSGPRTGNGLHAERVIKDLVIEFLTEHLSYELNRTSASQ